MAAQFHFAENAFALKFLFKRLQRLIDVIVANENLHLAKNSLKKPKKTKNRPRLPRRAHTTTAAPIA